MGCDVLFMDQPKARLGSLLADIDLIGLPHCIVVGERDLHNGTVAYHNRQHSDNRPVPADQVLPFVREQMDQ